MDSDKIQRNCAVRRHAEQQWCDRPTGIFGGSDSYFLMGLADRLDEWDMWREAESCRAIAKWLDNKRDRHV